MKYFLDTNICIYLINRRPDYLIQKFTKYAPKEILISSIVVSELEFGVEKSQQVIRNRARLEAFLTPFTVAAYDHAAARQYGIIRANLQKQGLLIGREDLLIAAHVLASNATLVTNNEREFLRVPNLKVENWI